MSPGLIKPPPGDTSMTFDLGPLPSPSRDTPPPGNANPFNLVDYASSTAASSPAAHLEPIPSSISGPFERPRDAAHPAPIPSSIFGPFDRPEDAANLQNKLNADDQPAPARDVQMGGTSDPALFTPHAAPKPTVRHEQQFPYQPSTPIRPSPVSRVVAAGSPLSVYPDIEHAVNVALDTLGPTSAPALPAAAQELGGTINPILLLPRDPTAAAALLDAGADADIEADTDPEVDIHAEIDAAMLNPTFNVEQYQEDDRPLFIPEDEAYTSSEDEADAEADADGEVAPEPAPELERATPFEPNTEPLANLAPETEPFPLWQDLFESEPQLAVQGTHPHPQPHPTASTMPSAPTQAPHQSPSKRKRTEHSPPSHPFSNDPYHHQGRLPLPAPAPASALPPPKKFKPDLAMHPHPHPQQHPHPHTAHLSSSTTEAAKRKAHLAARAAAAAASRIARESRQNRESFTLESWPPGASNSFSSLPSFASLAHVYANVPTLGSGSGVDSVSARALALASASASSPTSTLGLGAGVGAGAASTLGSGAGAGAGAVSTLFSSAGAGAGAASTLSPGAGTGFGAGAGAGASTGLGTTTGFGAVTGTGATPPPPSHHLILHRHETAAHARTNPTSSGAALTSTETFRLHQAWEARRIVQMRGTQGMSFPEIATRLNRRRLGRGWREMLGEREVYAVFVSELDGPNGGGDGGGNGGGNANGGSEGGKGGTGVEGGNGGREVRGRMANGFPGGARVKARR